MDKVKEALTMSINTMKGLYGGWRRTNAIKACENALAELERAVPVAWKHDCAALLTNNVELWINACPHCGKPRTPAVEPAILNNCLSNAKQEESGWLRAIDEALVCHDVGVVNADDTYEQAKDKLNKLLCVVQDIGAYFAKQEPAQSVPPAIDDDTKKMVLELCDAVYEHVSVWTYPYGRQPRELAKQVREKLEAGNGE